MPHLSDATTLLEVFRAHPGPVRPLLTLHERVMRDDSPVTVGERELIAAFVSALNGCGYCHGIHAATATAFGVDPDVLPAVLADLDAAPVDDRMRPLLAYVRRLTLTPARVSEADVTAVTAAGWSERALHDAAAVCALFNYMNRFVEGMGLRPDEAYAELSGRRLAEVGYLELAELL